MGSQQSSTNPVFQLCVSGSDVIVRFSEEESVDVRCKIGRASCRERVS